MFFSDFFTPDDILEVATNLASTPFSGHFVSYDFEFLCLCDDNGCKSVVPASSVLYITSHKAPGAPVVPFKPQAAKSLSEEDDSSVAPDESTSASEPEQTEPKPFTPMVVQASTAWKDEFSEGVEGSLRSPSVKVVDRVDIDFLNSRNERKKSVKTDRYAKPETKFTDPLYDLYPKAMGTVKSTGKSFAFITTNDGQDLLCMNFNIIGRVFPGDKVTFTTFMHFDKRANEDKLQARTAMKLTSVGEMISKMEEMRYERYGKNQIADLVAQLKEFFPDNEDVRDALRDLGFDRYEVRKPRPRHIAEKLTATEKPAEESEEELPAAEAIGDAEISEPSETADPSETVDPSVVAESAEDFEVSEPSEVSETSETAEELDTPEVSDPKE